MAQLRFFPALEWLRKTTPTTLKADILAGLANAAIVLHQGVAFAAIAGMLPDHRYYCCAFRLFLSYGFRADNRDFRAFVRQPCGRGNTRNHAIH